jgi:hypothetical protein
MAAEDGVAAVTRGCEGTLSGTVTVLIRAAGGTNLRSAPKGHRNCTLRLYLDGLSTLPGRQGDFPRPAGFTASRENPGSGSLRT